MIDSIKNRTIKLSSISADNQWNVETSVRPGEHCYAAHRGCVIHNDATNVNTKVLYCNKFITVAHFYRLSYFFNTEDFSRFKILVTNVNIESKPSHVKTDWKCNREIKERR